MQYRDLKVGQWFSTNSLPGRELKKVKKRGKSCCTPAHNAVTGNAKSKLLIDENEEVEPREDLRKKYEG